MNLKFKIILLALLIFASCKKKSVKLPVLNISGIQDTIYDNSQIWLFFKVQNDDTIVELNRNNSISTTNWIFNIDKRLPLHQVVPQLKKLIEKREKPAMHPKDEDDINYFSYVDSGSNTLSTVQFDVINYITDKLIDTKEFRNDSLSKHLFIGYANDISVNDSNMAIDQFDSYLNKQPDTIKLNLHLSFDKYLSYNDYLHLKAILQNNKNDSIIIDKNEYVSL
jgi:hypothetical protein